MDTEVREDSPVLVATREKRDAAQKELDGLLEAAASEKRELTDDESARFEKLASKIAKRDKDIEALKAEDERRAKAERASAGQATATEIGDQGVRVHSPMTYRQFGPDSFLSDLAAIMVPEAGFDRASAEARMTQHHKEVTIEARNNPELAKRMEEVLRTRSSTGTESRSAYEARVNPNTTFGTGGEFVPPLWIETMYAKLLRPGRVYADRVTHMALPPGIDVINIPKITVGSLTAIQSANAAPVASQDIQTTSVSANVNTIAGQEDISVQLLEQSPLALEGVIYDDLSRDYDQRLDLQVIAGTGTGGQHTGILNVSSASSPSVTQASAVSVSSATFWDGSTSGTQYRSIVKGVNQIETLTFSALPPTAIWCHPRRANSWAYAADAATGRPLFTPAKYGQYNQVGTNEGQPTPEGVAGELFGLPVVKDANMPTTMSGTATTGGTADAVVVLNENVPILWEGTMRMRALPEILSGTLQIRYQVYAYSAFLPTRFPQAISILTGNTGLAAPGF